MIRSIVLRALAPAAILLLAAGVWAVPVQNAVSPGGPAGNREAVRIRLPEEASVVGPKVTLGEVAEVTGKNEAIASRLRRLELGVAAPAGGFIKVTPAMVRITLKKAGIREVPVLEGADETRVKTESQTLDTSDLLSSVIAFILQQTGEEPSNVEVTLPTVRNLTLPAGTVTTRIKPPLSGKYQGSQLFTAEIRVDGRMVKSHPLRVRIETKRPAVVVTVRLERGDKLTESNASVQKVPVSQVSADAFRDLASVLGRTASRMMVPGNVVRIGDLSDPPMVKRNGTVSAVVKKGNIEVAVEAKALEDGKAGQVIRIQNISSGKIFKAKVLDEKTVQVVEPPKK